MALSFFVMPRSARVGVWIDGTARVPSIRGLPPCSPPVAFGMSRSSSPRRLSASVLNLGCPATPGPTAERDENTCRKDMTPSEKVAVGMALEYLEVPSAEERRKAGNARGGKGGEVTGKLPETSEKIGHGDVRDLVGSAVGMSGHTYHRAKTVVQPVKM